MSRPELVDSIEPVPSDDVAQPVRRLDAEEVARGTSQVVTLAVDSGLRYLSTAPYA